MVLALRSRPTAQTARWPLRKAASQLRPIRPMSLRPRALAAAAAAAPRQPGAAAQHRAALHRRFERRLFRAGWPSARCCPRRTAPRANPHPASHLPGHPPARPRRECVAHQRLATTRVSPHAHRDPARPDTHPRQYNPGALHPAGLRAGMWLSRPTTTTSSTISETRWPSFSGASQSSQRTRRSKR